MNAGDRVIVVKNTLVDGNLVGHKGVVETIDPLNPLSVGVRMEPDGVWLPWLIEELAIIEEAQS